MRKSIEKAFRNTRNFAKRNYDRGYKSIGSVVRKVMVPFYKRERRMRQRRFGRTYA